MVLASDSLRLLHQHRSNLHLLTWCAVLAAALLCTAAAVQIQVTRRWWNFEGVAVPTHLAQQLQVMNALVLGAAGHQQQQEAEEAPLHQQQT